MNAAELLTYLNARGGQEYRVTALLHVGRGKKASVRELGEYRLNVRGTQVQATGPSGQTRLLDRGEFMAVFSSYSFGPATPTGKMTDLGPLFG
ncbi:hypothetical protein QR90_03970 [Deinococcus radiopugnans]|uniref:Uncharacterized protein n=1 Tax=Deinococcus radiopugnans TaxID=57497 RepID=A0A0A7KGU4_9DEIO|nr:hypothetical protein [Deinococcus radiopugnans]AIZ44434.1 hypothetical protein QR90_03970 [Deinococcus radiopugnans]